MGPRPTVLRITNLEKGKEGSGLGAQMPIPARGYGTEIELLQALARFGRFVLSWAYLEIAL